MTNPKAIILLSCACFAYLWCANDQLVKLKSSGELLGDDVPGRGLKERRSNSANNPPATPAPTCTNEQRMKIMGQLGFQSDEAFKKSRDTSFRQAKSLRCPSATWLKSFYEEEANAIGSGDSFLGISVGCNKGHDAIRTARMGLSSAEFDASKWKVAFESQGYSKRSVCKQDSSDQATIKFPKRAGEMHCIEPMPSTYSQLKRASDKLGLENKGLVLTHAAISSAQGMVRFPSAEKGGQVGREDVGIDFCNHHRGASGCENVTVYSLEAYVDKYVKVEGPVNILQIDVEGWDFDVLFGASSVLDRTHYLEFEYHISGKWNKLHLPDAVRLLDGKGFTCYWAGMKGQLWRITECYFEIYNHWHGWSNVACVHRSQKKLSEKMEDIFLKTIQLG